MKFDPHLKQYTEYFLKKWENYFINLECRKPFYDSNFKTIKDDLNKN